jgi:cobalt-zinc-cadmium efflux system protein
MAHEHHHHGPTNLKKINTVFLIGIALNLIFVIVEVTSGLISNSLALLTDAGHNLSDIGSLVLSLFAFKMAAKKATETFTYGYKKSTILASLVNAVILLVAVGIIIWEAIKSFSQPAEIPGLSVAIVAAVGILINSITAFLFFRDKDKDLNIKGAFLHLFADALVSAGVVIGGVVMYFTGFYWIDPVLSIVIGVVILFSTVGLLKDSLKLSLDAVPGNVKPDKVRKAVLSSPGVTGMHHLHIWAMSTTENAMTAHVVVDKELAMDEISTLKHDLKHKLEHLNIRHATLEIEQGSKDCQEPGC